MLAVFFAHLFHAADMIDMRMSQHDAIDIVAMEQFLERAIEKIDPDRNALPGIEEKRTLAGADQPGVGARTGKR